MEHFNYIGVIGKEQVSKGVINMKKRGESESIGLFSVGQVVELFQSQGPMKSELRKKMEGSLL